MDPVPSLDSLLGDVGIEPRDVAYALNISFAPTRGKDAQNPFEDPDIILPSSTDNLYQRLELENLASIDLVKNAYRRQAIRWHPDRFQDMYRERATEEFKKVTEAHTTLSDPDRKASYDRKFHPRESPIVEPTEAPPRQRQPSRRKVAVPEIDQFLTPDQNATLDYLDTLVERGEIYLTAVGTTYKFGSVACDHCESKFPNRTVQLTYENKTTQLYDAGAHNLLVHGSRALVTYVMNNGAPPTSDEVRLMFGMSIVNQVYKDFGITPPRAQPAVGLQLPGGGILLRG